MVGSVIVHNDRIIGEGWHHKPGGPHAEVVAINSVRDKSLLQKSTLYVSLEPCSHFGKTPPCSDLIISSNIPKVVIGSIDSNQLVSGKGIDKLKTAGVDVTVGVLEAESHFLNRRFFTYHQKKRPYIILKWAQSGDGYIAPLPESRQNDKAAPIWITNRYSRQLVHQWRAEEQAILIGTQTAIDDNPRLDIRNWTGENPFRLVLDRNRRISKENHIFGKSAKTILISDTVHDGENAACSIDFTADIAPQICRIMFDEQLHSVIIEGGRQTLQTFIDADLWDEARVFTGTGRLLDGIRAPELKGHCSKLEIVGDELKIYHHD